MSVKTKKLFAFIGLALTVSALLYLALDSLSPSRRHQPNPYEYRLPTPLAADSLLRYAEINQIPIPARQLTALAIDPRNILYVAADSTLFILSSEGHEKTRIGLARDIHCLAAPDGKTLYVGFQDQIAVCDYRGRKKAVWSMLDSTSYLTALAISRENVYAADAGRRLVRCLDKQGRPVNNIGAKDSVKNAPGFDVPSPFFDLLVDADDQLWVVNPGNHTIEQYAENGNRKSFWGESGVSTAGFCGCCNPTHIARLQDGSFVTSEKGIARIKVYYASGQLCALVAGPEQFDEGTVGLDLAVDQEDHIYVLDPARRCVRVFAQKP
jgi:hypothetical protein